MRVRVKICGLTRPEDVEAAARLGADALGFVFAASPRQLTRDVAAGLTARVPDGIIRVGLFMDQAPGRVHEVLEAVPLELLQFHGRESNDYCRAFGLPFIKAISMRAGDPERQAAAVPDAAGLLLDSHEPGGAGGTGHRFNWAVRPDFGSRPTWLAGGLRPDNVAAAVRHFRPYAVDVSSGVETSPGIKNPDLIRAFIRQAKQEGNDDTPGD